MNALTALEATTREAARGPISTQVAQADHDQMPRTCREGVGGISMFMRVTRLFVTMRSAWQSSIKKARHCSITPLAADEGEWRMESRTRTSGGTKTEGALGVGIPEGIPTRSILFASRRVCTFQERQRKHNQGAVLVLLDLALDGCACACNAARGNVRSGVLPGRRCRHHET